MSGQITDELREWAEDNTLQDMVLTTYPPQHAVHGVLETLLRIADRIDAEHQKAEDEWRCKNGDMWLKGYAECHEELMEGHPVIVEDLEKAGWVKLPVDSDGAPIRVGDVIAYADNTKPKEVVALVPPSVVIVDDGPRYADMCRHYHVPTVEDVLREFGRGWHEQMNGPETFDIADYVERYAAKLRLADDGKEQ